MTEKYNGWTNYETWVVDLWLSNDEGAYITAREIVRAGETLPEEKTTLTEEETYQVGLELKDWVWNSIPELPGFNDAGFPLGLFTDLIQASLKEVNWSEIVESLRE